MSSWRDSAIEKSQAISDAWDVVKAYAGRAAEWLLFACMIVDIAEMLPGSIVPVAVANGVLAVQAITLDVAGFGLQSLADHAERLGDERAARKARSTGAVLISIMIATLVSVTLPLLWPALSVYTGPADKVLILVRVVMTVIYGHVMHSLRQYAEVRAQRELEEVRAEVQGLREELVQVREAAGQQAADMVQEVRAKVDDLAQQLEEQRAYKNDTPDETETALESTLEEPCCVPGNETRNITLLRTERRTKTETRRRTRTPADKASQAARYIKKNPEMTASELAKKAGISETYARTLLREYRAANA